MNKKLKILLYMIVISILFLCGCTSDSNNNSDNEDTENEESDDTNEDENIEEEDEQDDGQVDSSVPIYSGADSQGYSEGDPLWQDFDVPSGMSRETFFIDDGTIIDVYDWYKQNLGDWEIRRPYFGKNPDDGIIQMFDTLLKNDEEGAYIIMMDASDLPIDAVTVLGIATGAWSIAQESGENDEYDPFGMGEGSLYFDITPLDEDDYYAISPLGAVSGGDHTFPTDHGAFHWNDPDAYPPSYDVVSPLYGIITEIRYNQLAWPAGSGQSGTYNDYRVRIEHTNHFWSFIGHISELDDSILSQAGQLTIGGDTQFMDNPIFVEKGQAIGKTGGRPEAQTSLNWWVIDEDVVLNYVNPDRYNHFQYAVHFIERCIGNLATELNEKIRAADPYTWVRTAEPVTGKIDFDESGKLVGNWFHETVDVDDPMAEFDKHLSVVYDIWNPEKIIVGIGGTLGITATVYEAVDSQTDPAFVLTGDTLAYNLQGTEEFGETALKATILFEVVEDEKLKIEAFSGWQSNPSFTANAQYYIR